MTIAVTYDNGQVFQHFGHTEAFKLYRVENGEVVFSRVLSTNGTGGHEALAGFLRDWKVDTLICGGIGGGARAALDENGIRVYGGVTGSADEAVASLVSSSLAYDPDAHCDHHDHGDHDCGSHDCGGHGHDHACGSCSH